MALLDTTYGKDVLGTFVSDLVLQVLSYQAEAERQMIKQRQAEGIALAKEKGKHLGRPKKKLPDNFDDLYARYLKGEPMSNLSKECDTMSPTTLRQKFIDRYAEENKDKSN